MLAGFFQYSSFPSVTISVPDKNGNSIVLLINTAFEKLTGYTTDDIIGHTPFFLEQLQISVQNLENYLDGEHPCTHKDGRSIWVHYSLFPIKDNHLKTIFYGIILFDITNKKELGIEHQRLNDQFLNLVQNVPGMIYRCALDEHWTIKFMSDYIYELSGYPLSDFINNKVRSYASIIHPEDSDMVDLTVQEAISKKEPYTIEYRIVHANGNIRYVYERGQATFNENDNVNHLDGVITDITEKVLSQKEIEKLAFYDPLTRLPNRRLLIDRVEQIQLSSHRNKNYAALLFLDLDLFKELNDTLGHDCGDMLLQQVAQRLMDPIRQGDTAARLGGDEFIVVLNDLSEDRDEAQRQVVSVVDKIFSSLNNVYILKDYEYFISSSLGITLFKGETLTFDEILKQADLAMYEAKSSGRNTYRFFNR